ncbi:ankyrin repeat protein [Coprinopsis marcescibilis]|uniref:Ankyrin repeat protein n=1 Tax=Coprinopsis marcescibilis TaxID=230819 RepID=A0A5C3KUV4_COPMA|nr:ankyrin repeat protein [Coprinopsis marcescibilis]
MPQNIEAEAFLSRIAARVSLDDALKPAIDDETELRQHFATDRGHSRLLDPHVGLVDVFDGPPQIRQTQARVVKDEIDLSAKYVMPLPAEIRRPDGTPAMVADMEEFKKNWAIFTEGSLSQLTDWSNVVAAGGSVLACLAPLEEKDKVSKRAIRKHYHSAAYPTSDVDLFLWGLNAEQAEAKIVAIYEAVRDSVPWDVTCLRTKHTVSIHSQYPYRSVQIILRLYHSPAEVLAGFDVDAPCFAYDGSKVWGNPRAIVAAMRQCNTVDMTRRSPSYEVRLAKYARRGYEVYVPNLERDNVDPTIYERSIAKMLGLARLLVFEKLKDGDMRTSFLDARRQLRGRPNALARYTNRRMYKGDLKEETAIGGLEMNDYEVTSLHIPYGPGWDARRIDKLVYQTDLGMNSTFNPKNKKRRLHRHPAFFGTVQECLEDCCEECPEPVDDDERELQAKESDQYITGRIKFIEEDPGRQTMTGSFNPIDVGEWSDQVYIKQTEHFFRAIVANNLDAVTAYLSEEGFDINARDHVGRTCLHVAIMSGAPEVACRLIEAGVRISARLADGQMALHLAARYDQTDVVKKLVAKNEANKEQIEKVEDDDAMDEEKGSEETERPSSADDWSSDENDGRDVDIDMADAEGEDDNEDEEIEHDDNEDDDDEKEEETDSDDEDEDGGSRDRKGGAADPPESNAGDVPEDNEDEPDVFKIDDFDWDFGFTPLAYAVLFASCSMVDTLISAGASPLTPTTSNHNNANQLLPLALTILREDEDEASAIVERLIAGGATSATADSRLFTIFHKMVSAKKVKLVETVLGLEVNSKLVLDFPTIQSWSNVVFPIVTAIANKDYAMLAILLAYGVEITIKEEHITRALDAAEPKDRRNYSFYDNKYINQCFMPLETALANHDDVAQMLLASGVAYNLPLKQAVRTYCSADERMSIKDWVDDAINRIQAEIDKVDTVVVSSAPKEDPKEPEPLAGWKKYLDEFLNYDTGEIQTGDSSLAASEKLYEQAQRLTLLQGTKAYLDDIQRLLGARSAKGWKELFPDVETTAMSAAFGITPPVKWDDVETGPQSVTVKSKYAGLSQRYSVSVIATHLNDVYDELFEACFNGDNDTVERLCLLPKDGSEPTKPLLNINVQVTFHSDDSYSRSGLTPLYAACQGRHWSTAQLVLAIAASQYKPSSDEEEVKFSTSGITLDDDSDEEYDSDDSDVTVHKKREEKFIDIAKASSNVRSDVHPRFLLSEARVDYRYKAPGEEKTTSKSSNLIEIAILEQDLEAFSTIVTLYQSLTNPVEIPESLLDSILAIDNAEILHEFIRRSGLGLDFKEAKKATQHLPPIKNDKNRVYNGLLVHGKKRADLARRNDPDALYDGHTDPLLWKAANVRAHKIIEYLCTDKPLAAFRHYATKYNDNRAEQLRRVSDLEKMLPKWLGWTTNGLGESPLTAAISGNSLETIKLLFAKSPQLLKSCLHQTIKFGGYNVFLLAVMNNCKPEVLDFLLAKGISPAERDKNQRWNIYHYACKDNLVELVKHLLKKLPRDVNEALLRQESNPRLNTPIHIATHARAYAMVEVLLEFEPELALNRDVDGQTPLHIACSNAYIKTTQILLKKGAQNAGIFIEDGVGQTPYERIWLKAFKTKVGQQESYTSASTLEVRQPSEKPPRIDVEWLETELLRLQDTMDRLIAGGKVQNQEKFTFEINTFISVLKVNLTTAKQAFEKLPPIPKKEEEKPIIDPTDEWSGNVEKTWDIVRDKLASVTGHRELVKLLDVQVSVKANLDKIINNPAAEEDSDVEEDSEQADWQAGIVYHIFRNFGETDV